MGNSWGFDQSQKYPPILSSWSKIYLDWITPRIAQQSGRYTLRPVITNPDVLKIQIGFPDKEYLLIENRHRIKNSFEAKLPIQGGLLIYHIDDYASFHKDPGFLGQAGWPENGNHYRVAILQPDRKYNLEKGENRGDSGDLFGPKDELHPGNDFYPNTDTYQNGRIKKTGIRIYDIVNDGENISFSIDLPEGNIPGANTDVAQYTARPAKELVTTFAADIGSNGCMFDVVAGTNPIIISSLDIHVRVKHRKKDISNLVKVKIFTKEKSYEGHENNKEVWQVICEVALEPAGYFKRTVIPEEDFRAVTVHAGATQAFYVMLDKPDLKYSKGIEKHATAASNSDLKITEGTGVKGQFGKLWAPRVFNGFVKYHVIRPSDPGFLGAVNSLTESHTLTTNFDGNNGHYGNMWNVIAKGASVTVHGMDLHIRGKKNLDLDIYTKPGKYQGFENNILEWKNICCDNHLINFQGEGKATTIEASAFTPVQIEHGEVQAFYAVVKAKGGIRYNSASTSKTESDDIIEISKDGAGLKYGSSKIFRPRGFNGAIHYSASTSDVLAHAIARQRKELLATFSGENGSFGIMFDVKAKNNIKVEGIDIHTRATSQLTVELYTREGSSFAHMTSLSSWTLSCHVTITGKGRFERTSLPDDCLSSELAILRDQVLGVYITLTTNDLRYTNENVRGVGEMYADNEDMELAIGTGIGNYPLGANTDTYPQRIFNGVMKYSIIDQPPTVGTQLQTTMLWNNRSFGNIFTVVAKESGVRVLSIDIHTKSTDTVDVEVWTRSGTYDGYTENMNGWVNVARVSVLGQGADSVTSIPQNSFESVDIYPDQIQSFYVTLKSTDILYTNGDTQSTVDKRPVGTDHALTIYEGLGVGSYPLSSNTPTYLRRIFNGNIYYENM